MNACARAAGAENSNAAATAAPNKLKTEGIVSPFDFVSTIGRMRPRGQPIRNTGTLSRLVPLRLKTSKGGGPPETWAASDPGVIACAPAAKWPPAVCFAHPMARRDRRAGGGGAINPRRLLERHVQAYGDIGTEAG